MWTCCVWRPLPRQPPGPRAAAQCAAEPRLPVWQVPSCLSLRWTCGEPRARPVEALGGQRSPHRFSGSGKRAQGGALRSAPRCPATEGHAEAVASGQAASRRQKREYPAHQCWASDKPALTFNQVIKRVSFPSPQQLTNLSRVPGEKGHGRPAGECGRGQEARVSLEVGTRDACDESRGNQGPGRGCFRRA